MKGDLIFGILKILESAAFATADLLEALMSDYSSSYKKARRLMLSGPPPRESLVDALQEEFRENQKFYNLLYYLQKEGFVDKKKKQNIKKTFWLITKKGKKKLKSLKEQRHRTIPKKDYPVEASNDLKVVTFDIPEKERRKRVWLRRALLSLGFSMLQESVWIGKTKLPQEFIKDLRGLKLLPYVEIFSISKIGTIKQLK
jgi:DNA-binding transcriptional regulator PaaX